MNSPDTLVTGSSGHLGTALVLALPSYGFTPLGLDILPSPTTAIVGSITSRSLIRDILAENTSIRFIIHAATLHKPHVESHSKQDFVETNILGTLALLEEAVACEGRIESFIFTSTTSTFGRALTPSSSHGVLKANWIDESVVPIPKNIYGVTKISAEDICELIHRQSAGRMSIIILRTSRFFPEPDDEEERRLGWPNDENLKVNELTYRRADIADIVDAHFCALKKRETIKWGKYIISAPPPFTRDDRTLERLHHNASEVLREIYPQVDDIFGKRGWKYMESLDRVYDSSKAVKELDWHPLYTFERTLEKLAKGEDWRSELYHKVGKKGYHRETTGVYTVR